PSLTSRIAPSVLYHHAVNSVILTLSLHDALPISLLQQRLAERAEAGYRAGQVWEWAARGAAGYREMTNIPTSLRAQLEQEVPFSDRKSTRLNSSHGSISYAVLCLTTHILIVHTHG